MANIFTKMAEAVGGATAEVKEDLHNAIEEIKEERIPPFEDPTLDGEENGVPAKEEPKPAEASKDTLPGIPPAENEHADETKNAPDDLDAVDANTLPGVDPNPEVHEEVHLGDLAVTPESRFSVTGSDLNSIRFEAKSPLAVQFAEAILTVNGLPTVSQLTEQARQGEVKSGETAQLKETLEKEKKLWADRVKEVGHREEAAKKWKEELDALKAELDKREETVAEREKLAEESLKRHAERLAENAKKAEKAKARAEKSQKRKPESKKVDPAPRNRTSKAEDPLTPPPSFFAARREDADVPPMPPTPPQKLEEIIQEETKGSGNISVNPGSDIPEPAAVYINPRTGRTATYLKYVEAGKPANWIEEVRWLFKDGSFSSCEVSPELKEAFLQDDELDIQRSQQFSDEAQAALQKYYLERPLQRTTKR